MKPNKPSQLSEQDATVVTRILAEQRRRRLEQAKERLEKSGKSGEALGAETVDHHDTGCDAEQPLESCQHRLYYGEDMARAMKLASGQDTRTTLADLQHMGGVRPLAPVPADFAKRCQLLSDEFPHFQLIIKEKILPELAIGNFSGTGLKLPNLCVKGDPGVGKTYFASRISEVFDLPFTRINLEGAQGNFSIVGLDKSYSTHNPGEIVRFLSRRTENNYANGIVAFEEIDKAAGDARYSVENSLIQILEESTARTFRDMSIPELQLDITSLNFIFTANELTTVSAPVLSRLQPVELPPLEKYQAERIAANQFVKLVNELKLSSAGLKLTDSSLSVLGHISPRGQKAVLRSAIGKAIFKGHSDVVIPETIGHPVKRVQIGFI